MAQTAISVLMIVQSYYLNDPRVRREAESLAEAGYQVDVISLRGVDGLLEQTVNGVRIFGIALGRKHGNVMRYVYEYGVFLVCAAFLAAWLHVKEHYHVVQVHNLPDTLAIAAILPQLLGARVVFDAHEVMPEALQIKYGWPESSWKFRISIAIERYCLNLAHHVLTIHEPMRQLLIQGRGVPPEKITVVMNWPDERIFNSAPIVSDSVDHHFSLIYAGTIAERYGLQTAIRALPLIRDEIPGLRLRILGRGDYIAALQQLARELKVEDIVTFEAPVPLAEVPSVYHSVSVGISPQCDPLFGQIYFSTKVAEYLAVGLPAVVAETPIMSFYYDDSQVAFFMPGDYRDFAARVLKIYQDPAYRQLLIQNGMELSRRCHWSHERETYLSVISALVSRRG